MENKTKFYFIFSVVFLLVMYLFFLWIATAPNTPDMFIPTENHIFAYDDSDGMEDDTIKIGVIVPGASITVNQGVSFESVVRFCVDNVNGSGGLNGRKIKLYIFENKDLSVSSSLEAANRCVAEGVSAVIGGWYSSEAKAAAGVLQAAGVPMIVTGATNPDVTRVGDCIFRVSFIDSFQGAVLAGFSYRDLHARRVGIFTNAGNSYSPYLSEVFRKQFEDLGGTVVWQSDYIDSYKSYKAAVMGVKDKNVDVVFIPGYDQDTGEIVKLAKEMGIKAEFVGADGCGTAVYKYGGVSADGVYFAKVWDRKGYVHHGLDDVVKLWEQKNGSMEKDMIPLVIDAAYLLFDAIERSKTALCSDIKRSLTETKKFKGISGIYSFDKSRDPDKPVIINRVRSGNNEFVRTIKPEIIKLGSVFARTGDSAEEDFQDFAGVEFAVDEINLSGGILGKMIRIFEYDTKSTTVGARSAALNAVEDGVSFVIGATKSSQSIAAAAILQKSGVPMISPGSTNPRLTLIGDYIFRVCYSDDFQGKALAMFAVADLKATKAAVIVNVNNVYSVDIAHYFEEEFKQFGTIVLKSEYLQNSNDFTDIINEIKQKKPDVVFVPDYTRVSSYIINQARKAGIKAVFVGGDGWSDSMYQYTGEYLENCYYSDHWHPDMDNGFSDKIIEKVQMKYDCVIGSVMPLSYDAVCLVAESIRKSGDFSHKGIRDSVASIKDFRGVTGVIEFDKNRNPKKQLVILKFGKEKSEFYKIIDGENK